jgi:hypothetical protein
MDTSSLSFSFVRRFGEQDHPMNGMVHSWFIPQLHTLEPCDAMFMIPGDVESVYPCRKSLSDFDS